MLHLWLVVTRLRMVEPESFRTWQDTLVNHFFHGAEAKMEVEHALTSSMRQRYLKDLFVQWRGAVLSYDEGLVRGDAALAAAVWRNLFKARGDVDARVLAAVVAWMRRALVALERTRDEALREVWRPMVGTSPKMELPGVDKPVRELEELYKELGL